MSKDKMQFIMGNSLPMDEEFMTLMGKIFHLPPEEGQKQIDQLWEKRLAKFDKVWASLGAETVIDGSPKFNLDNVKNYWIWQGADPEIEKFIRTTIEHEKQRVAGESD